MRGAMQTCRRSSLFLHLLSLLRGMETVYGEVRRGDARWMISPLGHIYYPNLGARAPVWPTFTANCPGQPPPFSFACRSSDRVRSDSVFTSRHTAAVSSFSSLFRLPRRMRSETAVGGLITIIMTATCAATRDGMHRSDYFQGGMRSCLKTTSRWWTGSLFNLRSRRAPILARIFAFLARYPCDETAGNAQEVSSVRAIISFILK